MTHKKEYIHGNIVMLPTDDKTSIRLNDSNSLLYLNKSDDSDLGGYQHLYIITNDLVNVGDYVITPNNVVSKVFGELKGLLECSGDGDYHELDLRKIVATTDNLWSDNIPEGKSIPKLTDDFIHQYISRYNDISQRVHEVLLEITYEEIILDYQQIDDNFYEKNIKVNSDNTVNVYFPDQLKYTVNDVIEKMGLAFNAGLEVDDASDRYIDEWINDNL